MTAGVYALLTKEWRQVGSDGEWSLDDGELVVGPGLQDHPLYVALDFGTTSKLITRATDAVVAVITWGTTFPGLRNAPLKVPSGSTKWRVVLFSHGVGGWRLMNVSLTFHFLLLSTSLTVDSRRSVGSWRHVGISSQRSNTVMVPAQVRG